jgi:hypothetical protein
MTRKEEVEQAFNWRKTDKLSHGYAMIYAKVPKTIKRVFEIGIGGGQSLEAWLDIFPSSEVYGLDCNGKIVEDPRVKCINCDINLFNPEDHIKNADVKFDLIVDDGSHQTKDIISGWQKLNKYCSGIYVVEDVDFNYVQDITREMHNGGGVLSVIQTHTDNGSRAIVASFDKVIQW